MFEPYKANIFVQFERTLFTKGTLFNKFSIFKFFFVFLGEPMEWPKRVRRLVNRNRNVIFAGIRWKYRKEDQFGTLSDQPTG